LRTRRSRGITPCPRWSTGRTIRRGLDGTACAWEGGGGDDGRHDSGSSNKAVSGSPRSPWRDAGVWQGEISWAGGVGVAAGEGEATQRPPGGIARRGEGELGVPAKHIGCALVDFWGMPGGQIMGKAAAADRERPIRHRSRRSLDQVPVFDSVDRRVHGYPREDHSSATVHA